jgi:hypothetical protein
MTKLKNLAEAQKQIQECVRNQELSNVLLELIIEKPPISIQERLKIYQNAYLIRLSESVKDDFSRVEEQIGKEAFVEMIDEFIRKYPSTTQNLAQYSEAFPDFIKINKPEVFEAAQKDWMEILSTHSFEPTSKLTAQEVQSGKAFTLLTHPATVIRTVGAKIILSYRIAENVYFQEIDEKSKTLLELLTTERTLEELANLSEGLRIAPNDLTTSVSDWIQNGIIFCKPVL